MSDKSPTIVIVGQDKELAKNLSDFLTSQSFRVEVLATPDEVVDTVNRTKDSPTVVLADLSFPEEASFKLIEKLKETSALVPIIVKTVDVEVESAIKAVEAGAFDFVVKPLKFPQLMIPIKRALDYHKVKLVNLELNEILQAKNSGKALGVLGVIGTSEPMQKVFELVRRVASSTATVFISGESGTGKEVIAKAIHQLSERKDKAFVAINCSAIPEALLESELFGHSRGAFTGAVDKKIGLFETADGGTLFLDEIADLPLPLQAKILRVIQERKLKRVGENNYRDIDVRIITATHRSMAAEVNEKRFREDLYYRLNVIPVFIPPLRDRKEDILPLADYFLGRHAKLTNEKRKKLSPTAGQFLIDQAWRGNVRELENSLERAIVLSDHDLIQVDDLLILDSNNLDGYSSEKIQDFQSESANPAQFMTNKLLKLEDLNDAYIQHVLACTQGAKDEAAKILGIDRKTLYRKLAKTPSTEQQRLNPVSL